MTYKIHYSIYAAIFTYNIRKNITHTKQNIITYCCKYEIFLLLLLSSFLSECGCRCRLLTELDSLFSVFLCLLLLLVVFAISLMSLLLLVLLLLLLSVSISVSHSSTCFTLSLCMCHVLVYMYTCMPRLCECFVCACLYVCTFTWPTRTHKLCQQRAQVRRACFKIARNFL